ncbi:MAG: hypothetical protein GX552_19205, partial [Chloroflexi bacterium]|nr:hypothetical protein [Chloroflexota bacterium]
MTILSAVALLILVLDPLGNVPLFLAALRNVPHPRHRAIILRELLIALGVLIVFLFGGPYILRILQVSQSSLGIAGGIILLIISLNMIFPGAKGTFGETDEEPFIVPLAIPLIAGPSALTTLILLMAEAPAMWLSWLAALLLAWFVTGLILLFSDVIGRVLGERGTMAIERLM